MHSGGIADKVGNRFEARWLVYHLVGLLTGRARSITVEMLGDDEQGFEFSVDRGDVVEWHQCKRQISTGNWTVPALAEAGVLENFRRRLAVGPEVRCVFVSTDGSALKGLSEKRPATATPAAFEASLSKRESTSWSSLESLVGGAATAFDLLNRSDFRTLGEGDLLEMIEERLAYFFTRDPETLVSEFRDWVEQDENFNRPLRFDDITAFASSRKIKLREARLDQALPARLKQATGNYTGSYPALGSGLFEIKRPETEAIWTAIEDGARVVIAAGGPGFGKSAILKEIVARLDQRQVAHLAFRVDWAEGVTSVSGLGEHLIGESTNPAIILEQLAGKERAVLLIDQADAVSQMSGRVGALRSVVLDLVRRAQRYSHVQIVFACRTFDLENDHAYRDVAAHPGSVRVNIEAFTREQVDDVLTRLDIAADLANPRLLAVLSTPIGLTLAAELARAGSRDLRQVDQLSQLYESLLALREAEIRREFAIPWGLLAVLSRIAQEMSRRETLTVPTFILDDYASATDILQRSGLIVVRGSRISLFHESLFDFLHARAFVRSGQSFVDWLLGSEQTLFRRTQARQILSFLRDDDRARYLQDLETILLDVRVRAHVRHTVVRWLGTVADPTVAEWQLIERYAASDGLPRRAGPVLYSRPAWFDLLHDAGVISGWLRASLDDFPWLTGFLRTIAPHRPIEVAALARRIYALDPSRLPRMLDALRWLDAGPADPTPLADAIIEMLYASLPADWEQPQMGWYSYYSGWTKAAPVQAARILAAQYARWFALNPTGHPFDRHDEAGDKLHHVAELATQAPLALVTTLLPAMHEAMRRTRRDGPAPAKDEIWSFRPGQDGEDSIVHLIDIVRGALGRAAIEAPAEVEQLIEAIEPDQYETSLHLLLETVAANGEMLHPLLTWQLGNPGLFSAGWYRADAHSAARAMAAAMPYLSRADRERCEAMVLAIWPELDQLAQMLKQESPRRPPSDPRFDYRRHLLHLSGKQQWSILREIGPSRLSPHPAARLAVFERKFTGQKPELPECISVREIKSSISVEQASRMSDAAWLRAIVKISAPDRRDGDWHHYRGGAGDLARTLREVVKQAPDRFIPLLAELPVETSSAFAAAIVGGVGDAKPSSEQVEQIIAIVTSHPPALTDRHALIWLVRGCGEPWGPLASALVIDIALGDDDEDETSEPQQATKDREDPEYKRALELGGQLKGRAINTARGMALDLIGQQCWSSLEQFDHHRKLLGGAVANAGPLHFHAAFDVFVLSALKHDLACGIDWATRIARTAPEALLSRNGQRIIGWIGERNGMAFATLIEIYLDHPDIRLRAFGALCVAGRRLDDVTWQPLIDTLLGRGRFARAAIAAVAAANFMTMRFGTVATQWLLQFFEDDDEQVRKEATDCFRRLGSEGMRSHGGLFEAYAASRYFKTNHNYFLFQLKEAPAALDETTLDLVGKAIAAVDDEDRALGNHDLHYAGDLLLRIYASNLGNAARISRTLDLIDRLVELGLLEPSRLDQQ